MSTRMDRLVRLQLSFEFFPEGDKCIVFYFPVHCAHIHHDILVPIVQRPHGSNDVILATCIYARTCDEMLDGLSCHLAANEVWADHSSHICCHHNTTVVSFLVQGQLTYNKSNKKIVFCNEILREKQKKIAVEG